MSQLFVHASDNAGNLLRNSQQQDKRRVLFSQHEDKRHNNAGRPVAFFSTEKTEQRKGQEKRNISARIETVSLTSNRGCYWLMQDTRVYDETAHFGRIGRCTHLNMDRNESHVDGLMHPSKELQDVDAL